MQARPAITSVSSRAIAAQRKRIISMADYTAPMGSAAKRCGESQHEATCLTGKMMIK
jgi:hypothetical protein